MDAILDGSNAALAVARQLIAEIDLSRFRYPVRLEADQWIPGTIRITMWVTFDDRDSGRPGAGAISQQVWAEFIDRDMLLKILREMLHDFARHEIDECLLVNGRRIFDPHGGMPS